MKWQRPVEQLQQALAIQVRFLRTSSEAYDAGNDWEAVRMANAVFSIVDDRGHRSLLTQLGKRGRLRFPSQRNGILLDFHHWWDKDVIDCAEQHFTMTRRSLVFALLNKEAGSHVDVGFASMRKVAWELEQALLHGGLMSQD